MTLGQLALHVATIPAGLSQLGALDTFDAANANFHSPQPASAVEVAEALDSAVANVTQFLSSLTDAAADSPWRLTIHGNEVFACR